LNLFAPFRHVDDYRARLSVIDQRSVTDNL
jgi:hypothetical protein